MTDREVANNESGGPPGGNPADDNVGEVELSEVVEERPPESEPKAEAKGEAKPEPKVEKDKSDGGAAASDLPVDLETVIQQKNKELAEQHDRFLRLAADFDNFKKRAIKERAELLKYANENLVKQVLDAIDNLERALDHAETSDKQSLVEGVRLVENMFLQTLERFGIKRFSALGQPFDPAIHEAVQEVPSTDVPAGAVVFEVHKGYTYYDRLLRPARVVLSKGPPEAQPAPTTEATNGSGTQKTNG